MKILITGGAGLLGSHVIDYFLKRTDAELMVLDKSSISMRLKDVEAFDSPRFHLFTSDLTIPLPLEIGNIDYILHLAALTHPEDSITNSVPFILSNVLGTQRVLEFARRQKYLKLMIYASTVEVYGPAEPEQSFSETDRPHPSNPYAATKLGGEALCQAYYKTHGVPVCITNTMNLFGERQQPDKFIPTVIRSILRGEIVPIYSNPEKTKAGSRFYIHCQNYASAAVYLLNVGRPPQSYNVVGEQEIDNLEMAQRIARIMDKPLKYEMVDFHSSRPGHDLRYALSGKKMRKLGWRPIVSFEESLLKTIWWYLQPGNKQWLD